jgi:hypothetical protein
MDKVKRAVSNKEPSIEMILALDLESEFAIICFTKEAHKVSTHLLQRRSQGSVEGRTGANQSPAELWQCLSIRFVAFQLHDICQQATFFATGHFLVFNIQ